jgi:hypothetical protein
VSVEFPNRHPIMRARFFLQRAEECTVNERDAFEAYLDAAIVFGRSAIQWTQSKYEDKSNQEWKVWWKSLLKDQSIKFFRDYRNDIIHERPPKVHQIIKGGYIPEPGGSVPATSDPVTRATELYYFESSEIPATETVRRHLEKTTEHVLYAEAHFS